MDENRNYYFNNMCNSTWPSQQSDRNNVYPGSARSRSSALREYYHLEGDGSYSDTNSDRMSDLNSSRSLGSNSHHSAFQYQHMDLDNNILTRRYSSVDEYPVNASFSRASFHDKNYEIMCKSLQAELKRKTDSLNEMEKQKQELKDENNRLSVQLALERRKAVNINKKIKSIQENQAVLIRLKEEYTSSKANQSGVKQASTEENESQTDNDYECPHCVQTFEWRKKIDEEQRQKVELTKDTVQVKLSQISAIESTIGLLKSKLQESQFGFATLHDFAGNKYLKNIQALKKEIELLKKEVENQENKNTSLESTVNSQILTIGKQKRYKDILKRIIVKLERRQRQMTKEFNINESKSRPTISHQEKVIVQEIVRRYIVEKKFGKRSMQNSLRSSVHRTVSQTIITNSSSTATEASVIQAPSNIDYLATIPSADVSISQERTSLKAQFLSRNYETDAKENQRPRTRSLSKTKHRHLDLDSFENRSLTSKSLNNLHETCVNENEFLTNTDDFSSIPKNNENICDSKNENDFKNSISYCGDQTKAQINEKAVVSERTKKMKGRFSISTKK